MFGNFQNEVDCLSVKSLIDRDQSDYFSCRDLILGFYYRIETQFLQSM